MRKSLFAASGIIAALVLSVGAAMVFPPRDSADAPGHDSAPTVEAPLTADRVGTRGILPIEIDRELGALEVYLVLPDASLHPPPHGLRAEIWDLVTRVIPPHDTGHLIDRFKVANNPASAWTSWVTRHTQREDQWVLGVNLARVSNTTHVSAALLHEYGHLVALGSDQVLDQGHVCPTIRLPEGCAIPGGHLAEYHDAFWAAYDRRAPDPANTDPARARALYLERPADFVSEYAAMNVVEDFAETFAAFVHLERQASPEAYVGRLGFFEEREAFVEIRDRLRNDLDGTLGVFRLD